MTREIKFKAIIKETNEIFPVTTIWENSVCLDLTDSDYEYNSKVYGNDEIELLQYTGLKDKNGNKIFDQDNIKLKRVFFTDCSRQEVEKIECYEGTIIWFKHGWALNFDNKYLPMFWFDEESDELEILD